MENTYQFLRCCRICSAEIETGIAIFGEDGKNLYLQAKIRKYLYITISPEDKLPKMICDNCCKKIEGIHKFALMALTNQSTFHKSVANSSSNIESVLEPKKIENKGLLHTYLTKGIKEDQEKYCETEVTEMEVRIDPMSILQCSIEDDMSDTTSDTQGDTDVLTESSENCDDINENNRKSNCPLCLRFFTSELALQNHMWSHTPQSQNRRVLLNFNNGNCELDRANFENEDEKHNLIGIFELDSVENSACARYNCPICGKFISTKGNLKVHLETHRPKGKYECDICGRIFKTQCNLHRHKEYHEGIQFTCQVCGRVYPTNSTLRAHSITHSNLRPHKCPQCDKTFKRNQDLKFHINQHTGARPYQCPYCPKAFASSGNCFSHRKRMHPLEVERDREQVTKFE